MHPRNALCLLPHTLARAYEIDLSNNLIETVEAGAFAHMTKLFDLRLSHNKLSAIPELSANLDLCVKQFLCARGW